MFAQNDLMNRVSVGDPDAVDCRAALVKRLEEFVWRGSYRIPTPEIVAALLRDDALGRTDYVRSRSFLFGG